MVRIKSLLLNAADQVDRFTPSVDMHIREGETHLVVILVHSLFRNDSDVVQSGVFPHEKMTVDKFVCLIRKLKSFGYEFIHAEQLNCPECLPSRSALLTFDDGYCSIRNGLLPMEELGVPGLVFVVPWNVEQQECFWWDVCYRRLSREGVSERSILGFIDDEKRKSPAVIRESLIRRWGEESLSFETDLDRPMNLDELKELHSHPLISFGNHTFRHAALPFQEPQLIRSEIHDGGQFFKNEFGENPSFLAFPNGDYSSCALGIAADEGARFCLSIEPRGHRIRARRGDQVPRLLGRYMVSGERSIDRQVVGMTRAVSFASAMKRLKKHAY